MADAPRRGDNVIEMAVASDGSGTNSLFLAMEGSPVVEQINTAGTSFANLRRHQRLLPFLSRCAQHGGRHQQRGDVP